MRINICLFLFFVRSALFLAYYAVWSYSERLQISLKISKIVEINDAERCCQWQWQWAGSQSTTQATLLPPDPISLTKLHITLYIILFDSDILNVTNLTNSICVKFSELGNNFVLSIHYFVKTQLSLTRPTGPIQSICRDVSVSVCMFLKNNI